MLKGEKLERKWNSEWLASEHKARVRVPRLRPGELVVC